MLLQKYYILETHCIFLEVNNQLNTKIFQRDTVSSPESAPTFAELFEINDLKAQIQEKDTAILKLREKLNSFSGDVKERKVDVAPLGPKLRKNRTAHTDYIRHTQKEAATLREIIESERLLSPLNTSLAYASHTDYIRHTQKEAATLREIIESERLLRVTLVSSASGSKSQDNTKKNKIRRTQKKAKKTELEDHLRTVKSSLNKASVVNSKATSSVIKSVSNVNLNLKCASCNGCLFSDNHDACVVAYINSVNASKKSKSVKTSFKRKVWKPTGIVFKTVGYIWKPTGQTFTLVRNVCPLTRISTATIVPPREHIPIVKSTNKPVVTLVYTRKPKAMKVPNKMEPNKSWGSNSNVSSSHTDYRNDHVAKIMGYGDYKIRNVTISRVYYVEGLGHNLFSVGQFCDSDLEVA
nr:integrase, catalytic region, zinc finger, CCHC-type, peptidase aspartic, catalytic [Tanacetum cinerariifolium]